MLNVGKIVLDTLFVLRVLYYDFWGGDLNFLFSETYLGLRINFL